MRQNTARFYNRIGANFQTMLENNLTRRDAIQQLAKDWYKSPQSIARIIRTKIEVPSVSNPNQKTLFNFEEIE
jgi:hypothetical protein